ncbi:MAG TPA: TraM recognition domain-containing protein [Bryobacteraceae bacterium]|jgi:hypothetical protein|nr:TraM recognition domain-containing protein [Bryobacteraceae bacterium]
MNSLGAPLSVGARPSLSEITMHAIDKVLKRIALCLSDKDHVDWHVLVEGVFVSGAPGSGKSTTVGHQLGCGILETPHSGMLILTAKAEETKTWLKRAKQCGREKDVIVFSEASGHTFDPLHYEFTRPGRGQGDIENTVDYFSTLVALGDKEKAGQGHDPFWSRGNEQSIRNSVKLLELAEEPISIPNIDRLIKSLPTRPGEIEEAQWQAKYCAQLVERIKPRKDSLSKEQLGDLEFAIDHLLKRWPGFDERPRSSLEMTWAGMADRFLFNPFNRIFCGGQCSITPEMTMRDGKIIIVDFPLLEYGFETARLIQCMIKLTFQRAWLRRDLEESPNPVCLWQDEFQYFVTRRDNFFQQTCRGSRVAVVCLTQNILNLSEQLGEDQPGSKTKSFLGNLGLKIFLQQNEIESCNFAADQIGKEYTYLEGYNASAGQNEHAGVSGTKHLTHILEPVEFTKLQKPDSDSPYAEGIVYLSGRSFEATKTPRNPKGLNYLRVLFSREI